MQPSTTVPAPQTVDDLHRNLMVNYLPETWSAAELTELFAPHGDIETCHVVMNKQTGISKGYGFVKYYQRADAENALVNCNGYQAEGRTLIVKKAGLGKGPPGPAAVYVAGFTPSTVSESHLQAVFEQYGQVQRVKLHPPQAGKKGVAFVTFETYAEAELAMTAGNGQVLSNGDVLTIKLDNRTAQQARESQAQVGRGLQGMMLAPQYAAYQGGEIPGQKMMRRPTGGMMPGARFQPYSAPITKSKSMIAAAATPLPNGSDGNYCIFVFGATTPQILEQLLAPYGTIVSVRMTPGKKFGFVSMPNYNEVVNAINNLNGMTLQGGVTLQVRLASSEKKQENVQHAGAF